MNASLSTAEPAGARRSAATSRLAVAEKQPEPAIPGITKAMVRQYLRQLSKDGVLDHKPATVAEWRLAEIHLAKELKLSPLRIFFFASEAVAVHVGGRRADKLAAPAKALPLLERRPESVRNWGINDR